MKNKQKIIVISDTHGYNKILDELVVKHADAFAFLHLGDIETYQNNYPQYITVRGNNDFFCNYPTYHMFKVGSHKIFMIHSDGYYGASRYRELSRIAKAYDCDIVLYGHTHRKDHSVYEGITFINPGSTAYPRDGSSTYAILELDKNINVEFIEINREDYLD